MKKQHTLALCTWLACASVGASALAPREASAQAAGDETLADTRLAQGKAAYKKKKFEAARKALADAYQLRPNDETALYLGLASVKAKKPADGARYLKKYLDATQGTSSPEHDQAEAGLVEAQKKLGTIEVLAPRLTEIYLDAISEKVGVAPMEPLLVEPGTHSLRGRTADGATLVQEVKVVVGTKVTAKLGDPNSNPAPVVEDKNEQPEIAKPVEEKKHGPGIMSPPRTMVPVVIALGVTGVGLAGALIFGLSRNNANNAARAVDGEIRAHAGPGNGGAGTCVSTNPDVVRIYGGPCTQLKSNQDAADRNALLTNISFGVAGVGLVAAIGLYLFLPKGESGPPHHKPDARRTVPPSGLFGELRIDGIAPVSYGVHGNGVGMTGHF